MALTKIPGGLIEAGAITAASLNDDAVTTAKILDANITHAKLHTSMDLTGKTVTVATASGSTNTTAVASTAFVQQEIATLIGGAPSTLNDLNELAAAINDDANYNSTLTTALATKLPLAGGTLTGALTTNGVINTGTSHNLAINTPNSVRINIDSNNSATGESFIVGNNQTAVNQNSVLFKVQENGYVGIGTSNPAVELDILRHTNAYPLRIGSAQAQGRAIVFADMHSSPSKYNWIAGAQFGVDNGFEITPSTAVGGYTFTPGTGTTFLYDGKVGIGTDSPGTKLDIVESIAGFATRITNNNDGSQGLQVRTSDNDTGLHILDLQTSSSATGTNYSSVFTVSKGGQVVIGSDAAGHTAKALELIPPAAITDYASYILNIGGGVADNGVGVKSGIGFGYTGTARPAAPATIGYHTEATGGGTYGHLYFATRASSGQEQPTDRMIIDKDGYVGIGAPPSNNFKLLLQGTDSQEGLMIHAGASASQWLIRAEDNAGNKRFVVKSTGVSYFDGGNVGIGTDAPTDPLTIWNGTPGIAFKDTSSNGEAFWQLDGTQVKFVNKSSAGEMMFGTVNARRMSISQYGALHIDTVAGYTGRNWVNENTPASPLGGTGASTNTYQKLRLWVDGDINLSQGRGLHFGDVTDADPIVIREGAPSQSGVDKDKMEIWSRGQLTLTSGRSRISSGDTSGAGTARSSTYYIKKDAQMGGTWEEVITTPNGGDQTTRVFEDWTGRWVMVGRFAADARTSIQGTWSSVSGLSTAVAQSTATAFSADWGDIYPSEVRIMGCTDVEEYMDTRTIDFVYGNRPSGVHSYTPRQWKHFFAGQNADGMLANAGGSPRFGFTVGYAYDGKGRWYNPNMHGMGMSDGNTTNPRAAYTAATSNAFNWNTAADAKLLATHYRAFASQDSYQTTGFGSDDNVQGFYDSYPTEYTNMGGGVTGGGVHTTLSSAVFILLKLHW